MFLPFKVKIDKKSYLLKYFFARIRSFLQKIWSLCQKDKLLCNLIITLST